MIDQGLLQLITAPDPKPDAIVKILDRASRTWLDGTRSISEDAEIVVRLLRRSDDFERVLPGSRSVIDALAREAGLFPYIKATDLFRDQLAIEAHRVPNFEQMVFHAEQRRIFQKLLDGNNVILSAPTSFGKTLLVDALIASKRPKRVLITVPTIALLEERRRALSKRFPDYQIITQTFQELSESPAIIVGTQERILERHYVPDVDLFIIDEFYKLDLTSGDMRAQSLNLLLTNYIDSAAQIYLLGPSIQKNPINEQIHQNIEFVRTDYSPVAADIIKLDPPGTDPDKLAQVLNNESSASCLVYCRSPKSARTVAREQIARGVTSTSDLLRRIADWMRSSYHPNWYVADALEAGIGIHHGRIPRAIAHLMVRLFNAGEIKILLCTSSLIEGVNTVAEVVVIYDKYISTRKLDRFTFDNIKGRAGRMGEHFVGRIYLFNEAPEQVYDSLDIPILQSKDMMSDEALLQLSPDRLSGDNRIRRAQVLERAFVPENILTTYARFGVQEIEKCYFELDELLSSGNDDLLWSGIGTYRNILPTMEAIWGRIPFDKHGIRSARQFAFFANKLIRSSSIADFLSEVANGDDVDESLDLAFNFLKGAEYSYIQPLEMLQEMVAAIVGNPLAADYSKFLGDLTSWGLPGRSKALEDIGVPSPIIRKLIDLIHVDDYEEAAADIRRIVEEQQPSLSRVEREILSLTL
ncbi:DEAD/DEAH box helicase [Henriciella algicola]|uniref:DEAD/DEAH box helicase n=1 Tax=Henriciella algicola TaxID=1608422 RepID=A0A399RB40_9PROT|nr:DEAD/DEAH box helicase [Henriciella algicola]RIJ28648.1 hypothetical protein D1222_09695 [Henriciella algicola]